MILEKINKKNIIIVITIVLLASATLIYTTQSTKIEEEQIVEEKIEIKEETKTKEETKIKIDIKGEVNTPGVYELKEGSRVSDAIEKGGGLTENADTSLINLSKNLTDEMVIIIYNKYELEKIEKPTTIVEYIEKKCECPDKINDACINKQTETDNKETKNEKISINKATIEDLQKIPGIGESKAKAIIEYREKNGDFKKIEDITNVTGIGENTFEKFKDYITL